MIIITLLLVIINACKEAPTREELLTQKKGWKLTAITCDPPYEMEEGHLITNLFNYRMRDCELDDIIFFLKDKSQILDPGKKLCDSYPLVSSGNWDLLDNDQKLKFYFLNYPEPFVGSILILDKKTLRLTIVFNEEDGTKLAKISRSAVNSKTIKSYILTLTYTKP
ncbi:MAG: hypothetical protein FWF65_02130 [Bacteroidetes bacterium]|nr:hypothetical protein [Bacteroidota bacterium]